MRTRSRIKLMLDGLERIDRSLFSAPVGALAYAEWRYTILTNNSLLPSLVQSFPTSTVAPSFHAPVNVHPISLLPRPQHPYSDPPRLTHHRNLSTNLQSVHLTQSTIQTPDSTRNAS